MKRRLVVSVLWVVFSCATAASADTSSSLSIAGLVRQPLHLSTEDLEGFQEVRVQLNDVMQDGRFRGVFFYRGMPLRDLLTLAGIQKPEGNFKKQVDLAVRIRNREGEEIALSWGEIFYRNPASVVVATAATPVMPHKDCRSCHSPDFYEPLMGQFERQIAFPKLVVSGDAFGDRSLEGICSVEVMEVRPRISGDRSARLYAPRFSVTGAVRGSAVYDDLAGFPRREASVTVVGEGKGYHGRNRYEGVPLKAVIEKAEIKDPLNTVLVASAPDGYRSLFSCGEILFTALGERVIIADRVNGEAIEEGGKFALVVPDDLMADRFVKAIETVEAVSLARRGRVCVVGIGCGDTHLVTLEAISAMAGADAFVCSKDLQARLATYIGGKPVLFDPYAMVPPVLRRENPGLSETEIEALLEEKRRAAAGLINAVLEKDRTVVVLDYGDPTVWSGLRWLRDFYGENVLAYVPGISSFNASNALLNRDIVCGGSVVITTPWGLRKNRGMLQSVAAKDETLVIFMGLKDMPALASLLMTYYPPDTPTCLAYRAGYKNSEHRIETTLGRLVQEAKAYPEKFLGLIYVGPCLGAQGASRCP